jgi:hemerythrin
MDSQISVRQRLSKHVATQTTIGKTMMEYINTWLHNNIKSNDEKLLNYTNEGCINTLSCQGY